MLNVVILAAGVGKRMLSSLPKVLQPIAGRPMLYHLLDTARRIEADRLVIVVGHGQTAIREAMADQRDVHFVSQSPQLGTGHAVQQAVPALEVSGKSDVTMVLYGDVPLVQPQTLRALLASSDGGLGLLTQNLADPSGYGRIVRDVSGRVNAIVEEKDATPSQREIQEVNTGMLVAPTSELIQWLARLDNNNAQAEYYLTDIVGMAVSDGVEVSTVCAQAPFETLGVNNREQQACLERLWQRELAKRQLVAGVTLADPDRFDLRGDLRCGQDVFIDVGCIFKGNVVLGNNVTIGAHCVLENTVIGDGTRIEPYSHLSDSVVGESAKIGPYARLRPGTELAHHVHVGNFVEIKNSRFGPESKANHLTYVGDAEVGARVNIGAGTITCNYDGVNKHQTVIEDDAFIGSDTQLVAPVRVGKGATLGAGTTLTKDAPANKLTLSRSSQKTIETWQRPVKQTK
jgi:bifunctional UDP-N-acetylglucosamine pyrophosphorylase / glucosamine-1-phosphate N-acetyltransferase